MATGIQRAVKIAGTQTDLANLLGVSQATVWKWVQRGYAPPRRCIEIEMHTGVDREDLLSEKELMLMRRLARKS